MYRHLLLLAGVLLIASPAGAHRTSKRKPQRSDRSTWRVPPPLRASWKNAAIRVPRNYHRQLDRSFLRGEPLDLRSRSAAAAHDNRSWRVPPPLRASWKNAAIRVPRDYHRQLDRSFLRGEPLDLRGRTGRPRTIQNKPVR
jgi:hypothetical protein